MNFSDDRRYQLSLIAEEVFVNICSYAYPEKDGDIEVVSLCGSGREAVSAFAEVICDKIGC